MSDICSPPIKKWNDFYSTVLSYAILAPLYLIITLILLFPIYCIAGGIYSALFYDHWLAGGALILAGFGVMPGAFGALAELKENNIWMNLDTRESSEITLVSSSGKQLRVILVHLH